MSQPWKLLPLAAILAVIGAVLLVPGGVTRPDTASADYQCGEPDQRILDVEIRNLDTDTLVASDGIVVSISPDPQAATGGGQRNYVDNGNNDDSNSVGRVRENDACRTTGPDDYTASLVDFPDDFECDVVVGNRTFTLPESNTGNAVELIVENCGSAATATATGTVTTTATATATATATGTVTATPGAASTVTTSASPVMISCSGTSIVTIQVRDAAGQPVPAGTAVTITTTLGSVSPSSGQTTDASGNAFVFLTAPAGQGGTATVTATSGSATGSTDVEVNCGASATATTAPPPTASSGGGVISPPNTGEAGLADGGTGKGWTAYAGVALLLAAITLGAVGIVKVRA